MNPSPSRREVLLSTGTALVSGAVPIKASPQAPTSQGKPIKVGQIGVGHAHAGKLAIFRSSPDFEVVGIVEPDAQLKTKAEMDSTYKGLKWMTRGQLLETPGLQLVLVETKVENLLENAELCVAAGMNVHIDKPAGDSLPRLKGIFEIAAKKKLLVQMGYMYRYNPAIVLLHEFLKKGWLGEVFEVHTVMSKAVDPLDRKRFAKFPGGMMFELGCHILDLVIRILGKPDSVTAFSRTAGKVEDGLKDNMLAVLGYPRALATVKSSALEVGGFDRRHLVVCGTEGTFHIQPLDNPAARVSLSKNQGKYQKGLNEIRFPVYNRYVDDALDIARILRGEKAPDFSPAHDLAVQETLLRACELPLDR
ncbi:MAG: Gfo/Idh/MocA family oxidoreductase [Planctomycetota bacterium]|nr:Gfo/Idh/MocA family oxidoreductase [Planctomycetota bacterium]